MPPIAHVLRRYLRRPHRRVHSIKCYRPRLEPLEDRLVLSHAVVNVAEGAQIDWSGQKGERIQIISRLQPSPLPHNVYLKFNSFQAGKGFVTLSGTQPQTIYYTLGYSPDLGLGFPTDAHPFTINNSQGVTGTIEVNTGADIHTPQPPKFTSAPTTTFRVNEAGSYPITVQGDGNIYVSIAGAPELKSWIHLNYTNGAFLLSGTPPSNSARSYALTITAKNDIGTATQNFKLYISPGNTRTWSGRALLDPGNWSNPKNWKEDAKPDSGNVLIFPGGLNPNWFSINNMVGLSISRIDIQGSYQLKGNPITLTGNLTDTGGFTSFAIPITLSGNAITFTVAAGATLNDTALISGNSSLIKAGAGTLSVIAKNTYTGSTNLNEGILSLPAGAVTLGGGHLIVSSGKSTLAGAGDCHLMTQVDLNGGGLIVKGKVTFEDYLRANADFEIDAGGSVKSTLVQTREPIQGAGKLTIGGPGKFSLSAGIYNGNQVIANPGSLLIVPGGAALNAGSNLILKQGSNLEFHGKGSGTITVTGGLLNFQPGTASTDFKGAILLQSGTIQAYGAADAALGAANLTITPAGSATLLGDVKKVLSNPVDLRGGSVNVRGCIISGQVSVNGDTTFVAPGSVTLAGHVTGPANLILAGLSSTLRPTAILDQGSEIIIDKATNLVSDAGGPGSLTVKSGTLQFGERVSNFTGTVTLQSGSISTSPYVQYPYSPMGTGHLVIQGTGKATLNERDKLGLANAVDLLGGALTLGTPCTVVGQITVSADTQIVGPGSLGIEGNVIGGGKLTLATGGELLAKGSLSQGTEVIVGTGAKFGLDGKGNGAVTVKGGTLQFELHSNNFAGPVTLESGTIGTAPGLPLQPMGSGTVTVKASGKVTIDSSKTSGIKSVPNALVLEKGTLLLKGDLPFDGQITVNGDTEIDAAGPNTIEPQVDFSKAISGSGNLTIVGPGKVALQHIAASGHVTAGKSSDVLMAGGSTIDSGGKLYVDDGSKVLYNGVGTGTIFVVGGTLDFQSQVLPGNEFTGTIQLQSGTVKADGGSKAALSGGTLIVKPDGKATLSGTGKEIDGPTQLQGGTLNLVGTCIFSGQVSVLADTQTAGSGSVHFAGQITGTAKLTLTTSSELTSTSTLNFGSKLIVATGATLVAGGAKGSGSINVDGGTLRYAGGSYNFSGLVTLEKGKVQTDPSSPLQPLGAGTLIIKPTGAAILEANGSGLTTVPSGIAFQAASPGGSLTLVGDFEFKGPVTNKQSTQILLVAGDDVSIVGAIGGGGPLLFTGPGNVYLKGNIGDTRITAGPKSTVVLMDGFAQSDNGIPKAIGGGVVVDKRTT